MVAIKKEKGQRGATSLNSLSDAQLSTVKKVYEDVKDMIDKRNKKYTQLNDRTLKEYIDDSEKRLN